MLFEVYGTSVIGGRDYQEDSWSLTSQRGVHRSSNSEQGVDVLDHAFLALVADGIGGGGNGDIASQLVAERLPTIFFDQIDNSDGLHDAVTAIDIELGIKKSKNHNYGKSMGTTLVSAYIDAGKMDFASVGDSLILRFRDDEIHFMNELHEYGVEVDQHSIITNADLYAAQNLSGRSHITSAILGTGVQKVQIARREIEIGDIYILASDGIELLAPEILRRLVSTYKNQPIEALAQSIIQLVETKGDVFQHGNHDNCTLLIIKCVGQSTENTENISQKNDQLRTGILQSLSRNKETDALITPQTDLQSNIKRLAVPIIGTVIVITLLSTLIFKDFGFLSGQTTNQSKQNEAPKLNAPSTIDAPLPVTRNKNNPHH